MKLWELHINDFKFFSEVEQDSPLLRIDGKHLLIYGENGSGKSTIYWALYTLLEASMKDNDIEIKKYFKKRGNDSLVNIHSIGRNNTYIKVVLKDDNGQNSKIVKVSLKDLSLRGDIDVIESSMATDFINYRVLFQLHNLKHSKDNNLWQWFKEEVLPYVKKGSEPCLKELETLKKGPDKIKNIDGEDIFPTASLRTSAIVEERGNYQKYKIYKQKVKSWNDWLKGFLSDIVNQANISIGTNFGYNFKIKLDLETKFPEFNDTIGSTIKWFNPKIIISISEYEGIQNPRIKKPHTFLNEAKWSAIGLSLRFAILDTKLYNADLKALVIDDMLLSLDMSNREVVVDLLLNRFINDFQVILMTHDRFFFEMVKYKISQRRFNDWKYFEMFDYRSGAINKPLIIESTNLIEKAWVLYHRRELALAANTLRKATEKLCKAYLTAQERLNTNYSIKNLHQMIEAFRSKGEENGLESAKLLQLLEYKDRILNPNSHYDIEVPLFKNELENAIKTIEELAFETGINV